MSTDYADKIAKIESLTLMLKEAFQPMPVPQGAAPPPQAAPPGADPNAQMQGVPPPGVDPAAQMQGGAPPPDQGQIEGILSELMGNMEQIASAMEQQKQVVASVQQQMQQFMQVNAETGARLGMLEKALKAPSPHEGVPAQMM